MFETCLFLRAHFRLEHRQGALPADHRRQRNGDIADSQHALLNARDGKHSTLVPKRAAQQSCRDKANRMIGGALSSREAGRTLAVG